MMRLVTVVLGALVVGMTAATAFADSSADLFEGKCAMCHGANGAGKGKVPPLTTAEVQQKSGAELKTAIEMGTKPTRG